MGSYIHYYQQDQNGQENQGEQWAQLRCQTTFARVRVDESGEGFQSATAFGEVSYAEVVNTQCQAQDKSTNHTWP